ncbi:hypothetical protein PTSG_00279 [Salpingoeca rosetta]|uniref:SH3 domain-containing protein n=1 Tax=Salpingoeca rosetta (strain ATCC 50818 / BSB-021) TaxID=946362 RepID=F2TW13_SALR5|nr:uncharacterized protein PTSG_00279 [Salpingoeca rosetta]EGD72259.1 hypothetical protein PTSG_00279 [Salpingoeca rosetta]|eukprot:XP_004998830.1 hypothetical protein PTSG_00279 [Salpingoeca rosetta]
MADGDEDAGWGFVVAHHDFPAQEKGDLKLTQGDVVRVLQATNDEWLEGVLGDNQGIFPLNFVNRTDPPNNGRAEATESHTAAAASSDLSFRAGDTIDLLQRPSATHYRGRLHSKEGLVPTSKIRVTTALVPYAIASFDFDEGQAGDLELRIGDNIVLLKQVNDEWLQGYSRRTHKKGMFPAAFVDVKVTLDEASVMHVKTAPPPARKASLGKHPAPSKPPPPATTPPARSLPPPRKSPKATQRRQSSTKTSPSSSRPKGAAVALYDYTSTEQGDLQFHAHDEIVLLKQVNPEWYEGFVRTQPAVKGIFPANFVHVTKEIPPSPAPSPQQARAPAPAAKAKPPPPKPQPQPQPRQSAAPPAKPYAPPPKRASATPSSTSAQAPTATASTTTATPAPKPKPIPKPKAKPKPTPKPPPPAPAAKTAAPPPATAVTTARTTTTTTTAPAAPAAPAMSAAATAEQERRKPSPRPPPSSNHPRHGSPDLKPMRAAPTPTRNAPRPPQATAAPAKKAVPSVCRPPGAVPLRRAPSTRPAAETVQQRRLSMGKPEKPQTKPRQTHTQAPAKPAPRPRPQPKPRAERPVRPRSRVLSMSIQDQSAKQLSSVHEEPEETLEEQIARLEALHDEALDREIGFETLLSVMTDLDDDQRQEKEEQLEAARREVADLEEQLNTLYAQRGDVNEEESDMSLSESQILPNGRDLGSVKQAISELNARIEELEQELADEKKQAKAAQKLADLASLDTATAKMDVSQVQAEAQRHQQLIQTKELFISSLQAEREGLIAQIPEHLRQRDSMLVREVEMLEQVAATEAEQHELQEKKAKKRANVSKELVETEEEYLDNLLLCKQAYLDPATGLPSKTGFDVAILFGNLEEVIDVVQAFCLRLKREHEKPVEQQEFGRAFWYVGAEFLTLMDGDHHGRMTHDTGDLTPQDTVPEAIGMAVVVWTFEAESEIEVSCDENEEVEVLSYEDPDGNSEWVLIRRSTGEEGYVAANFLQFDS